MTVGHPRPGAWRAAWRLLGGTLRAAWLALTLATLLALAAGSLLTALSTAVFGLASTLAEAVLDGRSVRADAQRRMTAQADEAASLERRLASQADEVAALDRRLAAATDTAARRTAAHADEVAALDRRLAGLTDDLAARAAREAAREAALGRRVAGTVDRIVARSVRVQAANLGSMAGEALPFVGVAVIAAATGFEVRSTCDSVNDLQALDRAFNPDREVDAREVCGLHVPTAGELWATVRASPGAAWDRARGFFADLPEVDWSVTYQWLLDGYDRVASSLWRDGEALP